jgi:ABC-type sugar transport system permease subunit
MTRPIAGAATRAGHTDILISYVYNLAFAGGRGFDYGLASAVTIVIFFIVATITLFQFRYTQMWEEVSENV